MMPAGRFFLSLLCPVLLGGCYSAWRQHTPASQDTHSAPAGMTLVWSDEFNRSALDPEKWAAEQSCWGGGNNERQCYTDRPDNIQVKDGKLHLIAMPENFTAARYSQDKGDRGGMVTQSHTSGKVRTRGLASWTYGRFEARIKLPQGQSTWPAFWMMPEHDTYGDWPLSGEIDIMEAVNLGAACADCPAGDIETRSGVALHFGQSWPQNAVIYQRRALPRGRQAFHVFSVEWTADRINWFVDGHRVFSVGKAQWHTATVEKSQNPNAPFDQPFHLILNLAVGGDLPDGDGRGPFESSSFPAEMIIDWVRVYQSE